MFIFHFSHNFYHQPNKKETIRTQKRKSIKFPIKYLYGRTNTNIGKRKQKTHLWLRLKGTSRCVLSISSYSYPLKIFNSLKKQKLHLTIIQEQNNSQKESFSQLKRMRKGMDSHLVVFVPLHYVDSHGYFLDFASNGWGRRSIEQLETTNEDE